MVNPFTLSFGKVPNEYINRYKERTLIVEEFSATPSVNNMYIISGARGCGKTVLLNDICNEFDSMNDWIVVRLSIETNLVESLAVKLAANEKMKPSYVEAKLTFPFVSISAKIEESDNLRTYETIIEDMLKVVQKKGKRVLVAIDEFSKTDSMRLLSSLFQMYMGQGYPLYLIMSGLHEEIESLQRAKGLTFLLRAIRIYLDPLNYTSVRARYASSLGVNNETAEEMARIVKGYSYAFQVLGYLYYINKPEHIDDILPELDVMLADNVYNKMWQKTGGLSRDIVNLIVDGVTDVGEIKKRVNITQDKFSPYRDRLIKRGLLHDPSRGELVIALPRFREYVLERRY